MDGPGTLSELTGTLNNFLYMNIEWEHGIFSLEVVTVFPWII